MNWDLPPSESNVWEIINSGENDSQTYWEIREINHRPLPPTVPEEFNVTGSAGEHPQLNWALNNNQVINGYNIYREENGEGYNLIATVGAGINYYVDTEIILGNSKLDPTVCYRITAFGPEFESYPTLSKCKKYEGISKHAYSINNNSEKKVDKLYDAYPNPFNPTTKIRFDLAENSNIKISVYNILGSELVELIDMFKEKGTYEVDFDGRNLPSGTYIYKMETEKKVITKLFMLLK